MGVLGGAAVLMCNKMGQCKLVGSTCVHLQPPCVSLLSAGSVREEFCEPLPRNDMPQCSVEAWGTMVDSFRFLELQYVVSYHYFARALGRGQPATLVDGALRAEPQYSSLSVRRISPLVAVRCSVRWSCTQLVCELARLRARWATLRARWVTLRARWVTLRARWVMLRARWVTLRARWVTLRAR
jgi:hypothetical protein